LSIPIDPDFPDSSFSPLFSQMGEMEPPVSPATSPSSKKEKLKKIVKGTVKPSPERPIFGLR
jgi:hypothetical protein